MNKSDDENYREEKCCTVIEAIGDFYWEYDIVSEIFSFSSNFLTLLGYSSQDKITQEEWGALVHPDDWQRHNDFYSKFIRGAIENYVLEFRIGNQYGEYITLRERGVIFAYDDNGDALKIIGTHSVISYNSIENQHTHVEAILEYGEYLVWEIDRRGYFTYMSTHAQKLLGYRVHEFIGKKIFDCMPKVEVKRVLPIFQDAFCHKEKIKDLLNVKVNKEGKSIYFMSNASPFFDEDGELLGYRGVDKDVSKEVRLEQQLKQQKIILHQREEELILANTQLIEKAQKEALRTKSQFFANMSEDIRSPIGEVVNIAHMALGSELEPKKRKYLEDIEMSAHSLLTLLDQILDLSKLEVDELHLIKHNFDLIKMIDDMMHILDLQAQEKGLKIDISYGQAVHRYYMGDARRLSEVITNLISNAINFSQYGTIELFIDQIDSDRVRFEVRDCGMGLSQKEQEDLFKPFDKIESAMSLGLTLSKHLVEMMEGKIWCECDSENGSNFIFEIRLEEGQIVASDTQKKELLEDLKNSLHTLQGSNILLIQNHLSDQERITTALEHSGIVIDTAQNSMEAIHMYQDHPTHYELILMDLKMPVLSGIEVAKELRRSGATITIIGLIDDEESLDESNELFNEYLTKPIKVSKLYKALLKYITPKSIVSHKINSKQKGRIFPEFNTVDTALGLSYANNNKSLYTEILHNFRAEYYGIYFEILDEEELNRTLDALKENARNIGALKLHQAVLNYESQRKLPFLSKLYSELHKIIEEIEEKLVAD